MTEKTQHMRDPNRWLETEPGVWVELDDDDAPELTDADFARMRPATEVFPHLVKRHRGPQKAPTKEQIAIRLDPDILEHFRATGSGWHGRINAALRAHIERG